MVIVGISGKAGHGKDTCARLFARQAREKYGKSSLIWPFSGMLKIKVYGEAGGQYDLEDVWNAATPEIRDDLQQKGTEEGRCIFGMDLWTYQMEAFIWSLRSSGVVPDVLLIPDVRFPNEVDFIHRGGRVQGENADVPNLVLRILSDRPTRANPHFSEIALDHYQDFDGYIVNSTMHSISDLDCQMGTWVDQMFGTGEGRN